MSVETQSGGMFNSYKIKYSPETHKLLKVLMDEVKLTTAQRSQVKESLEKGKPLPMITKKCFRPSRVDENLFDLKRNYYFSKRGRDQIVRSGAYERDRYQFIGKTIDLEKEKEKLQNIMVYGKNVKATQETNTAPSKKVTVPKIITTEERVDELVIEIQDRIEFLNDMESMGKRKEYESMIKQEIAGKLREIEKLDPGIAKKYVNCLNF